jgi:hypothetical protein
MQAQECNGHDLLLRRSPAPVSCRLPPAPGSGTSRVHCALIPVALEYSPNSAALPES